MQVSRVNEFQYQYAREFIVIFTMSLIELYRVRMNFIYLS